ncbi:hypothetical protein F442_17976, partial [Phytophthora nicotianae P10297]
MRSQTNADAANLRVYANRAVYNDENGQPLEEDGSIGAHSGSKKDALIVEVQPPQRSGVAVESQAVQLEKLLDTLEWKEPKRLCSSSGQDWPYQGAPEL